MEEYVNSAEQVVLGVIMFTGGWSHEEKSA